MSDFRPATILEISQYFFNTQGVCLPEHLEAYRDFVAKFYPNSAAYICFRYASEYNDSFYDSAIASHRVLNWNDEELKPLEGKEAEMEAAAMLLPFHVPEGGWYDRDYDPSKEIETHRGLYDYEAKIPVGDNGWVPFTIYTDKPCR